MTSRIIAVMANLKKRFQLLNTTSCILFIFPSIFFFHIFLHILKLCIIFCFAYEILLEVQKPHYVLGMTMDPNRLGTRPI